jgi:hypothetical protein
MAAGTVPSSFETPRKSAAPQDEVTPSPAADFRIYSHFVPRKRLK